MNRYSIHENLDVMRSNHLTPRDVVAVGGGTKNRVWLQAVSDICNVQQKIPSVTIGAAYGDAILAAVALGALPTLDAVTTWITYPHVFTPDTANAEVYARGYAIYRDLYQRTETSCT